MAGWFDYSGVPGAMPENIAADAGKTDLLTKLLTGIVHGTVTLPERVVKATQETAPGLRREDFTDIPAPGGAVVAAQPGDNMRAEVLGAATNMMGGALPWAKPGALGIFGGRMASTADLNALQRAEKMAAEGADRQAIWDATGWFQGGDKKWRFEIPDDKAKLNPNTFGTGDMPGGYPQEGPIAGQLWHPDLYAAYPDARRARGHFENDTTGGSYQEAAHSPTGDEVIKVSAKTVPNARSVALHEAQHLVQAREGFAPGGSPAYFTQGDEALDAMKALSYRRELAALERRNPAAAKMTPKQKDDLIRKEYEDMGAPEWFPGQQARDFAHDVEGNPQAILEKIAALYGTDRAVTPKTPRQLYNELPGEIEARNVSRRADMTPEQRRATPPWATEDVVARPIMNDLFGGRVGLLEQRGPQMSIGEPVVAPIRAYHGSPHDFDKFDLSKIGTGEGAQAYGHGLYFAENPKVAQDYRNRLAATDSPSFYTWRGMEVPGRSGPESHAISLAYHDNPATARRIADEGLKAANAGEAWAMEMGGPTYWEKMKSVADQIRSKREVEHKQGRMYEVGIRAKPEDFIDFDAKKLSQQTAPNFNDLLRERLQRARYLGVNENGPRQLDQAFRSWRMENAGMTETPIEAALSTRGALFGNSPEVISERLREAGIPGVKYLDEGSRSRNRGTRNFVVFDDGLVDILKKYGIAGLPAGAAAIGGYPGDASAQSGAAGLLEPGNIDIHNRPVVHNPDGSISTVRSIGVNDRGREVLIPTVGHDGTILSNADALRLYLLSGKHLGKFDTPENSDAFAQQLHDEQAQEYRGRGGGR